MNQLAKRATADAPLQTSLPEMRGSMTKKHHQKVSFRDEFIHFLRANEIEYDERFV